MEIILEEHNYIDIHTHLLPSVDDGSQSMDMTIQMLKIALEQGITTVIATPHYIAGESNSSVELLMELREKVQEEATKLHKDFKIFLGNELYYSDSVIDALKSGKALTLAGSRYVLVEYSTKAVYNMIYQGMGNLIRHGYIPILAHTERYECLHKREDLISELVKQGCYIQINSNSVIGGLFHSTASWSRRLIKQGLVHFLGSDCHNEKERKPLMKAAVKALSKSCDDSFIRQMLKNPANILENTYL